MEKKMNLRKRKLDKRMGAVLIFIAAALCVLLVLKLYAMKEITVLQYDAAAIPGDSSMTRFIDGSLEEGDRIRLAEMKEGEPVYKRGSSWYVGDDRRSFGGNYPVYVNEGTYLWLLTDSSSMITEDWMEEATAAGMLISDGTSFNFDGSPTGDLPVLFLKLSQNLYVNTKTVKVTGDAAGEISYPANSYLMFSEEKIRSLARQEDGTLVYGELSASFGMKVQVNGEEMTYQELLIRLGILAEETAQEEGYPDISPKTDELDEVPEEESGEELTEDTDSTDKKHQQKADAQDENRQEADQGNEGLQDAGKHENSGAQASQSAASSGADQKGDSGDDSGKNDSGKDDSDKDDSGKDDSEKNDSDKDHSENGDTGSHDANKEPAEKPDHGNTGSDGNTGTSTGDSTSNEGNSGANDDANGGNQTPGGDKGDSNNGSSQNGGNSGSGGNKSDSTSGSGTTGNQGDGTNSGGTDINGGVKVDPPEWVKPEAEITYAKENVGIYSLEAQLNVTDTYGCFDRVVLMMAWDAEDPHDTPDKDTPVQLRKTLRKKGDFSVDNLPPDEKIYVMAYLYYYAKDGSKIQEQEPFQTFILETDSFANIDHINLTYSDAIADSQNSYYYENQISLYDLYISGSNSNAVDKVYKGVLQVYKKGASEPQAEFTMTSGVLNKYKENHDLDYQTQISQFTLDSDTEYRYRLKLYDRYGHCFNDADKINWGEQQAINPETYINARGYDMEGDVYTPDPSAAFEPTVIRTDKEHGYWGYTHTSKEVPSASVDTSVENKKSGLSSINITMNVTDRQKALTAMAEESAENCAGTAPEQGGEPYRVYMALYSSTNGYELGKELYFLYDDSDSEPVLSIASDIGEYEPYDETTEGAKQYAYLPSGSLPSGQGSKTVKMTGMTAGETYMVRIFAVYDLNDNHAELTKDVEIGSSRFSANTMSSYGRMFYKLTASHVKTEQPEGVSSYDHTKYESSTAQEIKVEINPAKTTQLELVEDFLSKIQFELKYKSGSKAVLADLYLERDGKGNVPHLDRTVTVAAADLTEDGWYSIQLQKDKDYRAEVTANGMEESDLPDLWLDIPVTSIFTPEQNDDGSAYYNVNLWKAFTGITLRNGTKKYVSEMPKLRFSFGEGSLQSFTGYTMTCTSTATQGGREHPITAGSSSYRQVNFTTLKDMPYVTLEDMIQVGKYLYLVGVDFHDNDKAIQKKTVTVTNTDQVTKSVTTQTFELDYGASSGGQIARINIEGLKLERDYELKIAPDDIRRTGKTGAYRYQKEALYTYRYTAGEGVSGEIRMIGLTYPLKELSDDGKQHILSEYSKYEVGNFEYGSMGLQADGTITSSGSGTSSQTADPIEVTPGDIYYLNHLSSSSVTYMVFLDQDQKALGTTLRTIRSNAYVKVPDGAAYMQFQMSGTQQDSNGKTVYSPVLAQALKVYGESEDDKPLQNLQFVTKTEADDKGKRAAKAGDVLAVVNSEWNDTNRRNDYWTITFNEYGSDGRLLQTSSQTCYPGSTYTVQNSGTVNVEVVTPQPNLQGADGGAVEWDIRKIDTAQTDAFSKMNFDNLVTNYIASVTDKEKSLSGTPGNNVEISVSRTNLNTGAASSVPEECYGGRTDADGSYVNSRSFASESGYSYKIELAVYWRGEKFLLDTREVESSRNLYTIANGKQLLKTMTWPTGSFLVQGDLDVDETIRTMLNQTFSGNLNGNGYTLTTTFVNHGDNVFRTLGGTGVIENLEIKLELDASKAKYPFLYTGFIQINRGTMRNLVLRYSMGTSNYSHSYGGGFCRSNQGTIENFAIYFERPNGSSNIMSMGSGMGGACSQNSGIIRNGFVYDSSLLRISTGVYGGSDEVGLGSSGGLVGTNNSGAVIENVYGVLSMGVEKNASQKTAGSLGSFGLLAGNNVGMIKNSFTNGEIYFQSWEKKLGSSEQELVTVPVNSSRTWPGTSNQGKAYENNCKYFSNSVYRSNDSYTQYMNMEAALKSAKFYDGCINRDNAFVVGTQIDQGYYPIINMPDCMDGIQTSIMIGNAGMGAYPNYLSTSVMKRSEYLEGAADTAVYYEGDVISAEEYKALTSAAFAAGVEDWSVYLKAQEDGTYRVCQQFAIADFLFTNNGGYDISDLNVDGLTVIQLAQEKDTYTTIRALLTPGTWQNTLAASYGDSYEIRGFSYGLAGMKREVSLEKKYVDVRFFYPLSQESFPSAPVDSTRAVNYRLTEDIHFNQYESTDRTTAIAKFTEATMLGIFDGSGYTLDYEGISALTRVFKSVGAGGTIKNLRVENITLGAASESSTLPYIGLIARLEEGASADGIHMKHVVLKNAYQYAGCVAAYARAAHIRNCTVADVEMSSGKYASGLYIGGILGCNENGTILSIQNCFVRGLDMKLSQGSSVLAAGGILGYGYRNSDVDYPVITSCYAEGEISTNFSNCGGIAGQFNGAMEGSYSAVSIYGSTRMGSLIGYAKGDTLWNYQYHTNLVMSGELYNTSGAVTSRAVGAWEAAKVNLSKVYAVKGQLLNSQTSEDKMDVSTLSDPEDMKEYYFWTDEAAFGESWYLYGHDDIPSVKDAYVYPLLLNTDGETILPDQEAVYYEKEKPALTIESATAKRTGPENNGTYKLTMTLKLGVSDPDAFLNNSQDLKELLQSRISAEGLVLLPEEPKVALAGTTEAENADVVLSPDTMQNDKGETIPCLKAELRSVEAVNRWDSYRVTYTDSNGGKTTQKLVFQSPADESGATEDVLLYWELHNADDWENLLVEGTHGGTYENFRIMSDLSLQGRKAGTELKLNRLEGIRKNPDAEYDVRSTAWTTAPEYTVLSGALVSSYKSPWITDIAAGLKNLQISDITVTETGLGSYFGVIGQLSGDAEYVDFKNISIRTGSESTAGTYNYVGCIGYAGGKIANARLRDIKISGTGNAYYYSNVGGLAGYAMELENVAATASGEGTYSIAMGDDNMNVSRSYFGGIAGRVSNRSTGLYGEGLQVTGKDYTGGLAGNLYRGINEYAYREGQLPEIEAKNVTVKGTRYAGGIAGYAINIQNVKATKVNVTASYSYAGGIAGYLHGSLLYGEISDSKVTVQTIDNAGGDVAGGISATGYGTLRSCKVYNTIINAANQYAGGIAGTGYYTIIGCSVGADSGEEGRITAANNYAGGLAGRLYSNTTSGQSSIIYNAVSGVKIQAKIYGGGVIGAANCMEIRYNEVDDSVEVAVTNSIGGGVGGLLAGCRTYYNIVGASVGNGNSIGGIAGQVEGYGYGTSAGGYANFHVTKMYGNVVANKSINGTNYVGGLTGLFAPGEKVIDPSTGQDISEEAGWTEKMSNENFYGNVIAPLSISGDNAKQQSWYGNYSGNNNYYTETPRYDAVSASLDKKANLKMPERSAATGLKENGLVVLSTDTLKKADLYTKAMSQGGLGFGSTVDTSSLTGGNYPLMKYPSYRVVGGATQSIVLPYQDDGIPIDPTAITTISMFSLEDAVNLAYASGVKTVNLDFTHIDSEMVSFQVVDAQGNPLMQEKTLESVAGSNKVCTMEYDFQTDFVVVLYSADHTEQETYGYTADMLRSTVMTWKNDYYYLSQEGICRGNADGTTELVKKGNFVHLYGGKALEADGTVTELD